MQIFTKTKVLEILCKSNKKWGMYTSFPEDVEDSELKKAAPWLNQLPIHEFTQIMVEGRAFLLFDTEKEMLNVFGKTVGDDGPTKLNKYKGKVSVYALTCNPQGELMNENT